MRESLRQFYYGEHLIARTWRTFIYVLVFVSILQLLMEYNVVEHRFSLPSLHATDLIIASIFLFDYLLRFTLSRHKKVFALRAFNILDLIAILPTFLIFFDGSQVLRGARVLRALRVLRLFKFIALAHRLESKLKPKRKKGLLAEKEVALYIKLKTFYANPSKSDYKRTLSREIKLLFNLLNKRINQEAQKGRVSHQTNFSVSFYELLRQAYPVVRTLIKYPECPNERRKLRFILTEMSTLLSGEVSLKKGDTIEERKTSRLAYLFLLFRSSINDVIIVATVAICLNFFIRFMGWNEGLSPALEYISVIEGVLGTLIIVITTFNIRYTTKKRYDTDLQAMKLMNFLTYYAGRIRFLVNAHETDDKARQKVTQELKYYFETIGFQILESADAPTLSDVRFDTTSMQALERIRFAIKPYKDQLDTRTFDKYEEMHGNASANINQFQIQATTSVPTLFSGLNFWMIRGTYFLLLTLSPLIALPRIMLMYIIQRAFFRTSRETDNAVLSHSLAHLPLEQRVIRRLCRIGAIFSY